MFRTSKLRICKHTIDLIFNNLEVLHLDLNVCIYVYSLTLIKNAGFDRLSFIKKENIYEILNI